MDFIRKLFLYFIIYWIFAIFTVTLVNAIFYLVLAKSLEFYKSDEFFFSIIFVPIMFGFGFGLARALGWDGKS